jgi:hypothetical protein
VKPLGWGFPQFAGACSRRVESSPCEIGADCLLPLVYLIKCAARFDEMRGRIDEWVQACGVCCIPA